ncbi:MAG: hypothetical protein U9O56_04885 [Campylobacterota bacterium]|nr:hypothetical protein [Campylobacterota bacterium]
MKFIFKIFIIFFYLFSYANDTVVAKDIYLSYTSYPKRVFTNQVFDLNLKAVILKSNNDFDKITTTFIDHENITIITDQPIWKKEKDSIYTSIFTVKVSDKNFRLPTTTIALIKENEIVDYLTIKPPKIIFEKIAIDQTYFSNIIAQELQVNSINTKQYTNNQLLITINIEAKNSNLEEFRLENYNEQGIKHFQRAYPIDELYYYAIIPTHKKDIKFTYYNTTINDFKTINLNINLKEDLVSTQTNLNPYNSSILIYKQTLVGVFLFISMLLFLITKKDRYLAFITFFIIILAYLFIPNKKIIIDKGTKVYILPTKNSTIFHTLKQKKLVKIINTKNEFQKVLFQNQTIGWIKNDIR